MFVCLFFFVVLVFFVWSFGLFGLWLVPLRQYSSSKFPSFYSPSPAFSQLIPPVRVNAFVGVERDVAPFLPAKCCAKKWAGGMNVLITLLLSCQIEALEYFRYLPNQFWPVELTMVTKSFVKDVEDLFWLPYSKQNRVRRFLFFIHQWNHHACTDSADCRSHCLRSVPHA